MKTINPPGKAPKSAFWLRCHLLSMLAVFAAGAQAQTITHVGGEGAIGDTSLPVSGGSAFVPNTGSMWAASSGENVSYSRLITKTVTMPTAGTATLKFNHRYNFEDDWDGGAVYVSINGSPFTYIDGSSFSQNGYVKVMSSSSGFPDGPFPDQESVFTGVSAGWSSPAYIESIASLGFLSAGDTVSVQFRAGWDWAGSNPAPNWEISTVQILDSASTAVLDADFFADGPSGCTVISDASVNGPWVYNGTSINQFEINATSQTSDRYVPATQGSVIDLNDAKLKVVLLSGDLAAGKTFSLFDLSGGSTLQGTYSSIELPPVAWDLSGLEPGGNGQIVALSGPVWTYTWNNPTPGTYNWETANWDYTPTDPAPASIWPNGVGTIVNLNTATGANTWNVTASSTTLGELRFGAVSGAGHIISGPEKTLVFDNGPINSEITRGDVSTTNGGAMNFATYQLNSPLDVNYAGTHITSMLIMQGKFTGSGSLNLKNVWGDADWSGFVLDASDHDYTGGTTLDNATLTLNGTIDTGVAMSNNSLLKINRSGEQVQSSIIGGPITGSGSVMKAEGTTMTFDNDLNSWTGQLRIVGNFPSPVRFTSIKNVGAGPSALGNPADAAAGTIYMNNGTATLEYIGSGDETDRIINANSFGEWWMWPTTIKASGTTTPASPFKITSNLEGNRAANLRLGGTGAGEWAGVIQNLAWTPENEQRVEKTDSGIWTLSGTNTYTGNTMVSAGTLILAPTGHIKFKVTNTATSLVSGTGTVEFNGTFDIDTSAVTAFTGSWNIVKVDTLSESFGETFNVAGFTQDPVDTNLWTMSDGPKNWTFDANTGDLTLGAAALITSFNYGSYAGVIDQAAKTITLHVPNGTDFATLNPTYVLSSGTCVPDSGSPPSPSFADQNPATYTVTDGSTVNNYSVTAIENPPAPGDVGAGLAMWLDATDASTMTLNQDGTTVEEWRDKFGSANKATKTGGSPTLITSGIGNLPTVQFNTSASMNDGVDRQSQATSIFLVARQTGGSNARVLTATGNNWLMGYHGGGYDRFYFEGWVYGSGPGSNTSPHLHAATIGGSGQNSTVYGADGSGNWVPLASNQGGTQGPKYLSLNGSEPSDCEISEVIVYNRALTNVEVTAVADYLSTKYNLGITMPAPTWAWIKPTAVGTYDWESANWDMPSYPNAQGIAAKCFTQAGNNIWTMNNPITLGQLQFGGDGGAAHTINGTGTLTFDNGTNNAVLSRGQDISTTTGASINVADITLNSTLNVNITSHLTSVMTISSRIGGTGGLNIIEAWGDSSWPGLILSGANTYTGNTTINTGTYTTRMTLANTGSLKFAVTNTGSNKITGTGTAALNGSFVIDTSAVTAQSGTWTLVDVATPIYGGTFSVAGFDDTDGDNVWTKVDWNRNWTFTEATGTLELVYTNNFTETTTLVEASSNPSVEGQEVIFTAVVMVDGVPEPLATGSMVFRVDGDVVATVSPLVSGQATCSTSSLTAGSHEITATYSGDEVYTGSVGTLTQNVDVAPADPYQEWDNEYDADLSDPAADEDGDGRSNFEEFAFGLNPTDPSSCNPIADISQLKSARKFSYTRRVGSGLTYSVLYSTDLQSWPQDEGAIEDQVFPGPGENVETVVMELGLTPASDRFFVRVQATR